MAQTTHIFRVKTAKRPVGKSPGLSRDMVAFFLQRYGRTDPGNGNHQRIVTFGVRG
ncbi:MAG: hypothetical protein WEA04_02725 [Candidatus Andersenbacteria bacterium]